MDKLNEKKWFVYLDDHHEGPFSALEIRQKMSEKAIQKDQYIWAEGMQDWKPMPEVPEFYELVQGEVTPTSAPPPPAPSQNQALAEAEPLVMEVSPADSLSESVVAEASPSLDLAAAVSEASATQEPKQSMSRSEPIPDFGPPVEGGPTEIPIQAMMEEAAVKQFGIESDPFPNVVAIDPTGADTPKAPVTKTITTKQQTLDDLADTTSEQAPTREEKKQKVGKLTKANIALVRENILVKGGISKFKRFLKFCTFVAFIFGMVWLYQQGYVSLVTNHPNFKAGIGFVKNISQPLVVLLAEKIPYVGQFVSPIPKLDDVSQEEYVILKQAAWASMASEGPKVAIALSTANSSAPIFHIASNLPDGTGFLLYLEGVNETLLNTLEFSSHTTITVTGKHGKSKAITKDDGTPIPRGEYNVYLAEAQQQPQAISEILLSRSENSSIKLPAYFPRGRKVVTKKQYFLGGSKDNTYFERLKDYHAIVRKRAKEDYEEIHQAVRTLVSQYNSSYGDFKDLQKRKKQRTDSLIAKEWNQRSTKWEKFQKEFTKFERWTIEYLQSSFYNNVYEQIKDASRNLSRMHEMHNAFFTKKTITDSFITQLHETQLNANQQIANLLKSVKQIETVMLDPNSLPKKLE